MSEKKSWKERQIERHRKQQRAEQAYQTQNENKPKQRKWPKGKIILVTCLLALIVGSIAIWQFAIQPSNSNGNQPIIPAEAIRIGPDGQINPSTAPIVNVGNNQYILSADIYGPIVVQRDNIVIDGANYMLQGVQEQGSRGIDLTGRMGVTVTNMKIEGFDYGIYLLGASKNTIHENDLTRNYVGIWLVNSINNTISKNSLTRNEMWAIFLRESSNNQLSENTMTLHGNYTVYMRLCTDNKIFENNIANNNMGIFFVESDDNIIYHNRFVDNQGHASNLNSVNIWDNDYPSGGNYWSNYKEIYPDAAQIENLGIWNIPFEIDEENIDRYPLVNR
jgi:parallel beta-helix repeat protein